MVVDVRGERLGCTITLFILPNFGELFPDVEALQLFGDQRLLWPTTETMHDILC